jgi:tetratricopeptide (TPR) repeat protein
MATRKMLSATAFVTAGLFVAVGGVALARAAGSPARAQHPVVTAPLGAAGGTLAQQIARSQQDLHLVPGNWQEWANLALDYVQQAKATVDPSYYPKAAAAARRSLRLQPSGNFVAMAAEAALATARHHFRAALSWSSRGLAIDPESAVLYGARTDALTQLGRYAAAAQSARHMELLRPGSDAEARLSYAAELSGNLPVARFYMRQALAHALGPADVAFARYYLGELALEAGHPRTALRDYAAGLLADPGYAALLEGRARAETELGRTTAALRDFATVVNRVPQPSYLLEYGQLLQSLGRRAAAQEQYRVFVVEERLFKANGVMLDTDQTLYDADHGDPIAALASARSALRTRPFLESWDAYAWVLHRLGRDRPALRAANRALRTGFHSALFRFHRGVIEHSLGLVSAARRDLTVALRIDPAFNPMLAPQARRLLQTMAAR